MWFCFPRNWPVNGLMNEKIFLISLTVIGFMSRKPIFTTYLCKKSGSEPCSDSGSWICSPMGRLFSRRTVDVSCGAGRGPGVWIMVSVLFSHVLSRLSSVKFQWISWVKWTLVEVSTDLNMALEVDCLVWIPVILLTV